MIKVFGVASFLFLFKNKKLIQKLYIRLNDMELINVNTPLCKNVCAFLIVQSESIKNKFNHMAQKQKAKTKKKTIILNNGQLWR